jgi:hypothetical protein
MAYKPVTRGGTLKIQIQRKPTITRLRPSGFHRARARGDVSDRAVMLGLRVAVLSRRHPGQDPFAGRNPEAAAGNMRPIHDPGYFL